MKENEGARFGRRDFLKTTAIAGVATALPGTVLPGRAAATAPKARTRGGKSRLLFMTDAPETYAKIIDALKSLKGADLAVTVAKVNYQKPEELGEAFRREDPDILFMVLARVTTISGNLPAAMGEVDVPVVILPVNFDLIMLEADLAAAFRMRGTYARLANSEAQALELVRTLTSPRILEGKKALIYGRPFDSTSVPAPNLDADYVYARTGVRIEYRPIEELRRRLEEVRPESAREEMERWRREAAAVVEPTEHDLLESARMYVLLRSIVDREGLSAISIDCLSFSFDAKSTIPLPCLAFTRLRDEGIAAPCEADVYASLSSMFLETVSRKPSYFCNVSSVDNEASSTVLRHCVAPVRLMGKEAPPLRYNLRDYHGFGKGVTPEVEFPAGIEVTMGVFSKDLKSFVWWPGRTRSRKSDTDRPSFPGTDSKMRRYCSNHLEVGIKDVDRFVQSIGGIHHVMVAGSYRKEIDEALTAMNVNVSGRADLAAPHA
jgi:L-fucose isomerase-like protein